MQNGAIGYRNIRTRLDKLLSTLIALIHVGLDDEFLQTGPVRVVVPTDNTDNFSSILERFLATDHELHRVARTTVNVVAVA
jgi:hypothetical protein